METELKEETLRPFYLLLYLGFTFTEAALKTNLDVVELSNYYNSDNNFKTQCNLRLQGALAKYANQMNKVLSSDSFDEIDELREKIKALPQIVTWGQICTKHDLTSEKLQIALNTYKNNFDAATACSLTLVDFYTYLEQHPEVSFRM